MALFHHCFAPSMMDQVEERLVKKYKNTNSLFIATISVKHRGTELNFECKEQTSTTSSDSDTMPSTSPTESSSVPPQPPTSPAQPLYTQQPRVSAVCTSPASMVVESPVSRVGSKRKRNQDDWLVKQMAPVNEHRMDLQEKLVQNIAGTLVTSEQI